MIPSPYPYMGFSLSWTFFSNEDDRYNQYPDTLQVPEQVYQDLEAVLRICQMLDLFTLTGLQAEAGSEMIPMEGDPAKAIAQLKDLVARGEVRYEIFQLCGYGQVLQPDGQKVRQEQLITLGDIRFFERSLTLRTSVSVWVPIGFDKTYLFPWQMELAQLNGPRLEQGLAQLQALLQLEVEPEPGTWNREHPIWQHGFRLYVNPEILEREAQALSIPQDTLRPFLPPNL